MSSAVFILFFFFFWSPFFPTIFTGPHSREERCNMACWGRGKEHHLKGQEFEKKGEKGKRGEREDKKKGGVAKMIRSHCA